MNKPNPIHPGEILAEEFLSPMHISQYRLAKDISVQPTRIHLIVKGKAGITADTALRLGRFFGMSSQFWLNLQAKYDLEMAKDQLGLRLDTEVTPMRSAPKTRVQAGDRVAKVRRTSSVKTMRSPLQQPRLAGRKGHGRSRVKST